MSPMDESPLPITDPVEDPTTGSDILESLANRREELSKDQRTLIPVPGYKTPMLLIEYKLMSGDDLTAIGRKVSHETKDPWYRQLYSAIDVMIAASVGVYTQVGNEEPQPLKIDGEPAQGFSSQLGEALRVDAGSPPRLRATVRGIFGRNDVALGNHSFRLQRWMSDTSVDVDEELFPGA